MDKLHLRDKIIGNCRLISAKHVLIIVYAVEFNRITIL